MAKIVLGSAVGEANAQAVNFFAVRNLLIMREARLRADLTLSSVYSEQGTFIVVGGPVDKVCSLLSDLHDDYGITNLNVTPQTVEEDEFIREASQDDFWTCQLSEPEVEDEAE